MGILDRLGKELLYFDGGMGTLLQEQGLKSGELPEVWNVTHKEVIEQIHQSYYQAGSDIVLTNTFGANRCKFHDEGYSLEEIILAAVQNAKNARDKITDRECYVGFDIGPTGKLLKPLGDLSFEAAYDVFKEAAILGERYGADFIHIETMSDTYEVKAAVLAAKEHTKLPVFVTTVFDEKGKLLTGADVPSVVALLEGLRVDAIGMNCSLGPEQMLPLVRQMRRYASLPMIVKPNAGLPKQKEGRTYYDIDKDAFAQFVREMVEEGVCAIGGCCGTTPEYIQALRSVCGNHKAKEIQPKNDTIVSSFGQAVILGDKPIIIGERINPTGKKRLKEALKKKEIDYILQEAISQQDAGAHVLDVNVGLPDIDEKELMCLAVREIQSVTSLPLQIDTVHPQAMEAAMRIYNGKPMINSVSGKQESMDMVFPLIQKYGGVVVGLTLDENGIPEDADGRVAIAGKIIEEASRYGIAKKNIVIDVLALTVSSDKDSARITLEAIRKVREQYGVRTVLGVSNISFGLPNRGIINSYFYAMAMQSGLSAGIINPMSKDMKKAYDSYVALMGMDENLSSYIGTYSNMEKEAAPVESTSLKYAIEKGLKEEAHRAAGELVKEKKPLEIIQEELIPALNLVGEGFEKGTVFLPQLLMSADAAKIAFAVLKDHMSKEGQSAENGPKIILATVKGDIHDIGKNIVKVLLENYGFDVIDLGKDVPPEVIVDQAIEEEVKVVGLSALMTTTVVSMEETIALLKKRKPECKTIVGGAVLNAEYAQLIHADYYAKDAMQTVRFAQQILGIEK